MSQWDQLQELMKEHRVLLERVQGFEGRLKALEAAMKPAGEAAPSPSTPFFASSPPAIRREPPPLPPSLEEANIETQAPTPALVVKPEKKPRVAPPPRRQSTAALGQAEAPSKEPAPPRPKRMGGWLRRLGPKEEMGLGNGAGHVLAATRGDSAGGDWDGLAGDLGDAALWGKSVAAAYACRLWLSGGPAAAGFWKTL